MQHVIQGPFGCTVSFSHPSHALLALCSRGKNLCVKLSLTLGQARLDKSILSLFCFLNFCHSLKKKPILAISTLVEGGHLQLLERWKCGGTYFSLIWLSFKNNLHSMNSWKIEGRNLLILFCNEFCVIK